MGATLEDLRALLREATHGLADVGEKRAFGSFAFCVQGATFALAWAKGGRIGVKLPDEVSRASLLGIEGAAAWAPNGKAMGAWVLVPEAWHDDPEELARWVRRAYEQVLRSGQREGEAAIAILHRGSTKARALEKKSGKSAAASSPRRKHSGATAKKLAAHGGRAKKAHRGADGGRKRGAARPRGQKR